MTNKNNLFKLNGKVQNYQWGGDAFLPALLGINNSDHKPFAEYWLGAHDNFPSELDGAQVRPLNQYISETPSVLGDEVRKEFQRLPYLFKVLDVKDMLSIQVHPSKQAAALEFENENRAGIPLSASNRNYKDDNHKPELMLALSDFWLLHGFKPEEELRSTISSIPEFAFMLPLFHQGGYQQLYKSLMETSQENVNNTLGTLLERIIPRYQDNSLKKNEPGFWAARAALTYNEPRKIDRGIFSVYLLNLVHLNPGEAIFQDAGVLHAYLEGQNMEIMANSDNVLRGGLTPKHIDVNELIKHVTFHAINPKIIRGKSINEFEQVYVTPARDFQLSRLFIPKSKTASQQAASAEIFMVMEGRVQMSEQGGQNLLLDKGQAAVAFAGCLLQLKAEEDCVIFKASVPVIKN